MREKTKNTAAVIDTIKAMSHTTDAELGAVIGITAQGVNKALRKARAGSADLTIETVARWADAFDLPLDVMFKPYQEALRWIVDNRPNITLNVDLTDSDRNDDKGLLGFDWTTPLVRIAHAGGGLFDLLTHANGTGGQLHAI